MVYEINPVLDDVAKWALDGEQEKQAFTPPPMDPAMMGGAPPMDPMMGGAPPMDPMMGGAPPMGPPPGAPPMDPMMGGAPPMGPPPMDPAMMGGAPPMGPPPGAPGAGGSKKIDPAFIYMELSRVRKLLTTLFQNMDMKLPGDILDDSSVAQVMFGQMPSSNPIGQEPQAPAPAAGAAPLPGIGGTGPVGPVEAPKTASVKDLFTKKSSDLDQSSVMAEALMRLAAANNK